MPQPEALLAQFMGRARSQLRDPLEVLALADSAADKLTSQGVLASLRDDVRTLLVLVKSWASGDYREISMRALVIVVGALLYFVVPTDAIPDFLVGIGFVDDAAVIAYALRAVRGELDAFRAWRARQSDSAVTEGVCSP